MKDCVVAAVVALIVAASPVAAAPAGTELLHNSTSSWTERDGLPSAHIYAITQDAAGYLWLGTSTGVIQFDGVRFRLWDALQGTPYMATAVLALLASRDGSFWVGFGSDQGLARWQNGRLISVLEPERPSPRCGSVAVRRHAGNDLGRRHWNARALPERALGSIRIR